MFDVWNKQIKIVSTYAGAGKDIIDAIELIRSKKVEVEDMITHRLPMNQTPKGFKLVSQAKKSMKVIINPNE
jgi:L-iditol 2-dehydrogenase